MRPRNVWRMVKSFVTFPVRLAKALLSIAFMVAVIVLALAVILFGVWVLVPEARNEIGTASDTAISVIKHAGKFGFSILGVVKGLLIGKGEDKDPAPKKEFTEPPSETEEFAALEKQIQECGWAIEKYTKQIEFADRVLGQHKPGDSINLGSETHSYEKVKESRDRMTRRREELKQELVEMESKVKPTLRL